MKRLTDHKKLALATETVRVLTQPALRQVAGGMPQAGTGTITSCGGTEDECTGLSHSGDWSTQGYCCA